jgi:hypothetical protein
MTSKHPLTPVRIAGVLYLVIIAFGLFAEVFVRARLIVPGDAASTAENILASEALFRAGFAADLIVFLADVALAILLYRIFKPVSKSLSMLASAFRLTQTAIIGLNLLNMFTALLILRDAEGSPQLALTFLEAHKYGYILGLTFFGVSTGIIGYLAYRSSRFPKSLGLLLGMAGLGYLVDSFSFFLIPGYDGSASAIVLAPALVAELWLALWLLLNRTGLGRRERTTAQPAGALA